MTAIAEKLKQCCTCHEWRPLDWYSKARNRKDGLYPQCRACRKIANRQSYLRNRESFLQRSKEYANRPDVKQRIKVRNKENYWNNREFHLEHAKQWRRDNLERRRAYIRKWDKENAEKVRAYKRAYKKRRYHQDGEVLSEEVWPRLIQMFRRRCVYCGRIKKLEQDHLWPLSCGGKHVIGNVVPACRSCNATKSNGFAPVFWWKQPA